ncbi:MFS transporter [Thalassiella azotivora]
MTSPDTGVTPAPPGGAGGRRDSLFRHHDFRQLWYGDAVSQLGVQLTMLALPVLAVRELAADEAQMGLLTTFEMLAFLVIGLPAGAWVDRWRKKRVLMAGDAVRGALLLTLPAAYVLDVLTIWQLYAVAVGVGAATVFFDVAYQSYLPDIVPSDRISEGNAKLQAVQSVAQVAGPAVGGSLIRVVGAPFTLLGTAVCMIGSIAFVGRIRQQESPPDRSTRRPLRTEIGEGLRFVRDHPLIRRITACTALANLFGATSGALLVLFALRDLDLTAAALGTVFSVGAVGGLLGAVVSDRVQRLVGEGRAIPLSALAWTPFFALTPVAAHAADVVPPVVLLAVGSFGGMFCVVVYNVTQVSFRQRVCPRPLLGRMNASIRFVVWGIQPFGGLLAAVLGTRFGIVPTLWVTVAGSLVATLPVVLSPLLRMRDLPRELDQHA